MTRKRIPNTEFYNVLKEGPELHFYLFLKEHFTEGETQIIGQNTRVDFTDSTGAVVAIPVPVNSCACSIAMVRGLTYFGHPSARNISVISSIDDTPGWVVIAAVRETKRHFSHICAYGWVSISVILSPHFLHLRIGRSPHIPFNDPRIPPPD